MLVSFLIPALTSRPWELMFDELSRQCSLFPGKTEVLHYLDSGEATSGKKRNTLMDHASGQYVAFVDDDDVISGDYVSEIVNGCRSGKDVVTFRLDMVKNGKPAKEVWQFGLWDQERHRGRMTANHLCAWKRPIADSVAWCEELGYADDQLWYQPLFYSGKAKTEHRISKVLYHYIYNDSVTANQRPKSIEFAKSYVGGGLSCYTEGTEIYVEVGNKEKRCRIPDGYVLLRDSKNREIVVGKQEFKRYHIIRID